jgi:hypothetical protein
MPRLVGFGTFAALLEEQISEKISRRILSACITSTNNDCQTRDAKSTRMTPGGHWPDEIPQCSGLLLRRDLISSAGLVAPSVQNNSGPAQGHCRPVPW